MGDIENKFDEVGGKVKEGLGKATDNNQLEAEGKADQVKAEVKKVVDKAEDVAKDAIDKAEEVAKDVVGKVQEVLHKDHHTK
ncbi:CsbD family protein [Corynebacterium choanae]|uniref:CsbD-like protein n=1 Tax=Corynebacterium choanae TaxID=1862358 RepID=A0A3G6JD81_9CORY|nr:CsbD family protein [Corynebacterium choanae]AZA14620.1 CsbD-like protein [Corynebacterium choanae]